MTTDLDSAVAGAEESRTRQRPHRLALSTAVTRSSLVLVLVALVAIFTVIDGQTFFSADNLRLILTTHVAAGIIALAVTVALVSGEVDLSVAGVMGAVAGLVAMLVSGGLSPFVAILVGLGFAAAFGLFNGLLVTYGRLNSIIATLATGTVATGAGLAIVGPNTITGLSPTFLNLFSSSIGGIQTAFFIFAVLTVVAIVVLQWTRLGRRLFFVGQNRDAAALLGIKVRRLTLGGMVAASLLAGFAGVVLTGQNGGANVTQTTGYLLPAFAAAFLGTSAIVPGRFNAGGTFIATYVLGTASVGLNMLGIEQWSTYLFNGGLLILALGAFTVVSLRKDRVAKRESVRAATRASGADDE